MSAKIIIKHGREKPIVQQHPWIFSGAIERIEGTAQPGDIVTVEDGKGRFLARGYWNARSQIQVRILTWHDEPIDDTWWHTQLQRAIHTRLHSLSGRSDAPQGRRLINAENDFLPGLVVDAYGPWLVLQALTLHIDQQKQAIAQHLQDLLQPSGIYERSDVDVRGKEGLRAATGRLLGEEPPDLIAIEEHDTRYWVDVRHGHKTGFYLDQRTNRGLLREWLRRMNAETKEPISLLNMFSYTGGFSLQVTGDSQTQVTSVDSSEDALGQLQRNREQNPHLVSPTHHVVQADAFEFLREQARNNTQYDVVVIDPPKFAQNASQVEGAARGYKDINLNAFRCIKPEGYLMTFSCSGAISADLFQKIVFGALADSKRQGQIVTHLGPSDDHPVALTFPEGSYLKGLLVRVY
jgi:23S rRNA (cytosine1962-C5)-methyltransferase